MDEIPEWFPEARLNFAENLLRFRDDQIAIIYDSEYGEDAQQLSFRELYIQVARVAAALRAGGVQTNDVVAAFAGNLPQVVIFMLASASIGAICTTLPPDFGPAAVTDRLLQTRPKFMLASSTTYYNGKWHDQMGKVREITNVVSSLERIILLGGNDNPLDGRFVNYADFIMPFEHISSIDFEQLPFNHPIYVLYSSGTTGKPKCLIHSAGGTLIQHLKEHRLHGDLTRKDIILQYTTIGWMMWHWLVSALAVGSTIILYEGSPFKPNPTQLWSLVEKYNVTRFGTSAKYIQHLQDTAIHPSKEFKLSQLKSIYSTGSPLSVANFHFVYEHIKKDLQLASITGGTDIISLFGGPNPMLPVYAGEIQCACLGMAVLAYTDDGQPILDKPGDLVCTRPFPSMPVGFWDDTPDRKLYRSAYFSHFPNIWHHGDFVMFNSATGGMVMLGRSDATLNPAGVRFGSAELYNVLAGFPKVVDSLVVGVKRSGDNDERVVMFLQTDAELSDDLVTQIKTRIRNSLSPRHVPALILPTPAVPYTLNGKKVEVAVRRILSGNHEAPVASLANPESLDYYRNLATDPLFLQ
jgi:acetoacetyl-CoA synthetase